MISDIPALPEINDKTPVDYILIQNKWKIVNTKTGTDSVGRFRADLDRLKEMRMKMKPIGSVIQRTCIAPPDIETTAITTSELSKPLPRLSSKQHHQPRTLTSIPANPLIDQSIRVIKPTEWIDCISRESKRVFVKDNWIVARILLPSIAKDSIGLKRLP